MPLEHDPANQPVTMSMLVGIANAIEDQAVQRYAALAEIMERRGEGATAAAFRVMLQEERAHVDAVARWAASLGEPVPDAAHFKWRLPVELSASWDEVAGSARLTPYRAFAIAVDNEQRAFTLYSYLAAHATDPRVVAGAERLALEELRHASLLRRWRRQAWHRERRAVPRQQPAVASVAALHALLAQSEAAITGRQRAIAERLQALGDDESAQLVEQLAQTPSLPVAGDSARGDLAPLADDPVHLLVAAQEPLEALSETLEGVMRTAEGELFAQAQGALANVVTRLSRISLQIGHRIADTGGSGRRTQEG